MQIVTYGHFFLHALFTAAPLEIKTEPGSPPRRRKKAGAGSAAAAAATPMSPTLSDERESLSNPLNVLWRVNFEEFNRRYAELLCSFHSTLTYVCAYGGIVFC